MVHKEEEVEEEEEEYREGGMKGAGVGVRGWGPRKAKRIIACILAVHLFSFGLKAWFLSP